MLLRSSLPVWCLLFIGWLPALGQEFEQEEKSIIDVVHRLFKGMETGDSAMVHSVFTPDATMATVFRDKNNRAVLFRDPSSLGNFLVAVGTPHTEAWNEPIWNVNIKIDGDLAQVWCDYAFYIGNRFSHCGVDAFHLHKGEDGWKIFHVADTRRKDNCNIPEAIRKKYQPDEEQ